MKLKLLLLSLIVSFAAHATTLTITVQDFSFTPKNTTINLGDTLMFTWVNGSHTTTSTSIPSGAVAWDHPMNAANTSFIYVPAVAGTYNYQCTPHASMGHVGSFIVNGTSGVAGYDFSKVIFDLYPNPAQHMLQVTMKEGAKAASVTITDLAGKQMPVTGNVRSDKMQLDISHLSNGLYFIRITEGDRIYVRKFVVNH